MAADYSNLGLDNNLYRKDSSPNSKLTATEIESMFADSEFFGSKMDNMGASKLSGGTLGQNEAITGTDGQYRVWKLGRLS